MRLGAELDRIDVGAAGEEQAVETVQGGGAVRSRPQLDHLGAGVLQRPHVGRVEFVGGAGNADPGLARHAAIATSSVSSKPTAPADLGRGPSAGRVTPARTAAASPMPARSSTMPSPTSPRASSSA